MTRDDDTHLTQHNLDLAFEAGKVHATAEILLGNETPSDDVMLDDQDIRDLVFRITSVKFSEETWTAQAISSTYADGYYATWEAHLGNSE